jgi:hypothetical protein
MPPRTHHRHPPKPPPTPAPVPPAPVPPVTGQYLFQDEFTGPRGALPTAGTSPSSKLWTLRNSGEIDGAYVVANAAVAYLDGSSNLILAVGQEASLGAKSGYFPAPILDTGGGPVTQQIASDGTPAKFAVRPGMSVEMRLAVNTVTGTWPAAWFIPVMSAGEYPANWSEIDMEESYGTGFADSSIWGNQPTGTNPVNMRDVRMLPKLDSGFHVFRLDYEGSGSTVTSIAMTIDNAAEPYSTLTAAQAKAAGYQWNYDTNEGMAIELCVQVFSKTSWQPTPPKAGSTPGTILTCDYVRAWSPAGPDPVAAKK